MVDCSVVVDCPAAGCEHSGPAQEREQTGLLPLMYPLKPVKFQNGYNFVTLEFKETGLPIHGNFL